MDFQESVDYLYGLGNEVAAMKLGLESTEKLLAALGNPQKNFLKVQIAGTNGKGSTCAFLDRICRSAYIKTGATTSPHLVSITERIKIDGAEISEEKFAEHGSKIREISEKLVETGELESVPTFFEQVTAIALSAFAEAKIELAILETGLGGRFDSVTAARAEIVAITPVDYDHQKILGDTLAQIAAEKAAIIRADTRVVLAPQKKEVERVILGRCREMQVKPVIASTDFVVKKHDIDFLKLLSATFKTERAVYPNVLLLSMLGRHQIANAATAICIAEILDDFNFDVSPTAIESGLENAEHKGRLEFWRDSSPPILFDGAHNAAGALALREFLDEFINEKITLVFGAMRDKDLTEIAEILFTKADKIIFTQPANPRSTTASELLGLMPEKFDENKVYITSTVAAALEKAREISRNGELILVTGSLYLVGEAQEILKKSFKQSENS